MKDNLASKNCNKAKCKSCMFGPNPIKLEPHRLEEINRYLKNFESSHVCHVTNLTCYGGLEVTAQSLFDKGILPDNKVETFLETARAFLNLK